MVNFLGGGDGEQTNTKTCGMISLECLDFCDSTLGLIALLVSSWMGEGAACEVAFMELQLQRPGKVSERVTQTML